MNRPARMAHALAFAGSVGVNVIANLVAAAMVYIGGSLLGIFPKSPELIIGSAAAVILAGLWPGLALIFSLRGVRRKVAMGIFNVLMGLVFVLPVALNLKYRPFWFPDGFAVTIGVLAILGGLHAIIIGVRQVRRDRITRSRIRGLHWIELPRMRQLG
jgi:hypothetical protein